MLRCSPSIFLARCVEIRNSGIDAVLHLAFAFSRFVLQRLEHEDVNMYSRKFSRKHKVETLLLLHLVAAFRGLDVEKWRPMQKTPKTLTSSSAPFSLYFEIMGIVRRSNTVRITSTSIKWLRILPASRLALKALVALQGMNAYYFLHSRARRCSVVLRAYSS